MNRLAYVLGTFPALTETFIAGEIEALRGAGVTVELFALRRPRRMWATAPGAALAAETCYSPSLVSGALWRANARAFRRAPGRYLATAATVLATTVLNPVYCLKSLAIFTMAAFFAERMRERQIRHIHGHWANYPATAAYAASRLLGIDYSFTAHAYDATLIRSMLREKIRRAALVVTCTRWNRELLGRVEPAARAKIVVNYHGVTLDALGGPRPAAPLPAEELQIVSCGSLYPRKGFSDLLAACRTLRDRGWKFRCRIIGEGPQRGPLERFIGRYGLGDTVELLGARPHGEAIAYCRAADLFVLPCVTDYLGWSELWTDPLLVLQVGPAIPLRPITDGIPNVLVEAMAVGVPVISTPVAGIPELIEHGRTGVLVPERDPGALASAIERLFEDSEQRGRLAAGAKQRVFRDFDRSKNIHDLVQIFSSFAEHGRSTRTFDHIGTGATAR